MNIAPSSGGRGVSRQELWIAFFLFAIAILSFNIYDIFFSQTMYVDDNDRFVRGLTNRIHEGIAERNYLRAYVIFPLYKLMAIDLRLARFAQVVLFYVPLALFIYFLLRRFAELTVIEAFFASVLPCVLPGQVQIPWFVDGSYTLQGMIVFLSVIYCSLRYLESDDAEIRWLVFAAILMAASVEMMDQAVFLAPPAVLIYFSANGGEVLDRRFLSLAGSQLMISLIKASDIYLTPTVSAAVPHTPSLEVIAFRLADAAYRLLPMTHSLEGDAIDSAFLWIGFLTILVTGLWLSDRHRRILIGLGLAWTFFASAAFLTVSPSFAPRYLHPASFGIGVALVLCVSTVCACATAGRRRNWRLLITAISLGVVFFVSGYSRNKIMYRRFKTHNLAHAAVLQELNRMRIPENSQFIVIDGNRIPTGGWWPYSSGYFKYATGRQDVTGIIGRISGRHDAFGADKRGFDQNHRMSGVSMDDPVFLFEMTCKKRCRLNQLGWALRWSDVGWELLHFDLESGKLIRQISGRDADELQVLVRDEGLVREDVMFFF